MLKRLSLLSITLVLTACAPIDNSEQSGNAVSSSSPINNFEIVAVSETITKTVLGGGLSTATYRISCPKNHLAIGNSYSQSSVGGYPVIVHTAGIAGEYSATRDFTMRYTLSVHKPTVGPADVTYTLRSNCLKVR